MSTHRDSPTGQQFHVRYTPKNGDKGPCWGHVFPTREEGERDLAWFLRNEYDDAKLFIRDVTPWREDS